MSFFNKLHGKKPKRARVWHSEQEIEAIQAKREKAWDAEHVEMRERATDLHFRRKELLEQLAAEKVDPVEVFRERKGDIVGRVKVSEFMLGLPGVDQEIMEQKLGDLDINQGRSMNGFAPEEEERMLAFLESDGPWRKSTD